MAVKEREFVLSICARGHEYIGPGPCPYCWPHRNEEAERRYARIF